MPHFDEIGSRIRKPRIFPQESHQHLVFQEKRVQPGDLANQRADVEPSIVARDDVLDISPGGHEAKAFAEIHGRVRVESPVLGPAAEINPLPAQIPHALYEDPDTIVHCILRRCKVVSCESSADV